MRLAPPLWLAVWLAPSTLAAPLAPADTWSSFSTSLTQPVNAGARELFVQDCRRIRVGGRLRISFATEEEEEGSVASLACTHGAGSVHNVAAQSASSDDDCDLSTALAEGGLESAAATQLSERCRQMLQAALRIPGVAASYRVAAHASLRGTATLAAAESSRQQQQLSPAEGALLPGGLAQGSVSHSRSVRGAAKLLRVREDGVDEVRARIPGVVTLAAGLLFGHSANVTVRGTEPLTEEESAATCPTSADGTACAGHGFCEEGSDSCTCEAGYAGTACEQAACPHGCGSHGLCIGAAGACMCDEGFSGANCSEQRCSSDCSQRGSCVAGACVCHAGFYGSDCSSHTLAACPGSCSGHGNCAVVGGREPVCLCHSKFLGVSCLQGENACTGVTCSDQGTCSVSSTGAATCSCYPGYSGPSCERFCPHNCTSTVSALGTSVAQGRCTDTLVTGSTTEKVCVCREGFSGPDCSQVCPARCNGHGDCVSGQCQCREGYAGAMCERLAPRYLGVVFLEGVQGVHPIILPVFILMVGLLFFCCVGYGFNRWRGRFGTSAIPMWDFYAKRWRNAPLLEPIFAVQAATQTAAPKDSKSG